MVDKLLMLANIAQDKKKRYQQYYFVVISDDDEELFAAMQKKQKTEVHVNKIGSHETKEKDTIASKIVTYDGFDWRKNKQSLCFRKYDLLSKHYQTLLKSFHVFLQQIKTSKDRFLKTDTQIRYWTAVTHYLTLYSLEQILVKDVIFPNLKNKFDANEPAGLKYFQLFYSTLKLS